MHIHAETLLLLSCVHCNEVFDLHRTTVSFVHATEAFANVCFQVLTPNMTNLCSITGLTLSRSLFGRVRTA